MDWELTLEPNVSRHLMTRRELQVSHALLLNGTKAVVTWITGDQQKELCKLDQSCKEHKNLRLVIAKYDLVKFEATGDATVMLFGYLPTEMTPYNFEFGINFREAKMKLERGENPAKKRVQNSDEDLSEWLMAEQLDGGIPSSPSSSPSDDDIEMDNDADDDFDERDSNASDGE